VLVGKDRGMSSQMEKIMHMVNKDTKLIPKIMEINPKHPIIQNMLRIYEKDPKDALLDKAVNSLFHSVLLLDGTLDDIQDMANGIQTLLKETTELYMKSSKKTAAAGPPKKKSTAGRKSTSGAKKNKPDERPTL
jgi:molecular chaperone HtpG